METHWVNVREREPQLGKEVQLLLVGKDCSIGYGSAALKADGWAFRSRPEYPIVVAWLESDRCLTREELSNVPKVSDDQGQDIAEYAVMVAVILIIVVGTVRLIGSNANTVFSNTASSIQ